MRVARKIVPTVTTTGRKGLGQKIFKEKGKFVSYDILNFVSNEKYPPKVGMFRRGSRSEYCAEPNCPDTATDCRPTARSRIGPATREAVRQCRCARAAGPEHLVFRDYHAERFGELDAAGLGLLRADD